MGWSKGVGRMVFIPRLQRPSSLGKGTKAGLMVIDGSGYFDSQ